MNQRPGESRLELLERNAAIFREVVPAVIEHVPDAILLVATNPVDVMTHLAATYAEQMGVPAHRVLGSGTLLDTARFRSLIGKHFNVDAQHVHGYVVGEHGDSEVLTWSVTRIAGIPLDRFATPEVSTISAEHRRQIDANVRQAAQQIIAGKGATYYGIGSAITRIVDAILHDQRAILCLCSRQTEVHGVRDVTLSWPTLIGGQGVEGTLPLDLTAEEQDAVQWSAKVLRSAIDSLEK